MKAWIARDKDGKYYMYSERPYRQQYYWGGHEIATWLDSKGEKFILDNPPITIEDWTEGPFEVELIIMVSTTHE